MRRLAPPRESAHGPSSSGIRYAPLLLVVINAFNSSKSFAFPTSGSPCVVGCGPGTEKGCGRRLANSALVVSAATAIRYACGNHGGRSRPRYPFFGRNTVSLIRRILPITLPGIVTGIAPQSHGHSVGSPRWVGHRDRRGMPILHRGSCVNNIQPDCAGSAPPVDAFSRLSAA